jgi:cell wall assembly regulator SMI1
MFACGGSRGGTHAMLGFMASELLDRAIARAVDARVVFRPQHKIERLEKLAAFAKAKLPDDFVAFYTQFDGAEGIGIADNCDLMSLEEILGACKLLCDVWSEIDQAPNPEADAGIAPVLWIDGWVPFASDGGGNYTCIDLAPDLVAGGHVGQVISYWNSDPEKKILSPSFADWLAAIEWTVDDDA